MSGPAGLPWRTYEIDDTNVFGIYDAGGHLVADCYPIELEPSAEQQAAHIVQAVNAFGPLVAALQRFIRPDGHTPSCGNYHGSTRACIPQCADARAALAAARAGEGEP